MADLTAQALIAGVWTKVPILTRDGFTITRLAQNQASRVDVDSASPADTHLRSVDKSNWSILPRMAR
jgi:hypothetical protein